MCGIVGYIGERSAESVILDGLKRLEYRGYDSAGVALLNHDHIDVRKKKGRLEKLKQILKDDALDEGVQGLGHTRWATHGRPNDRNAHPHTDCHCRFAAVHNGIIENYQEIRDWLVERGHRLRSETDSEVIPHLVEHYYKEQGEVLPAFQRAISRLEGSYAVAVMTLEDRERLFAARQASPLVIGVTEEETLLASDIPALLPYTRQVYVMEDGEVAVLTRGGVSFFDRRGQTVSKEQVDIDWDADQAELDGYQHFMLKEIHEQPDTIRRTFEQHVDPQGESVRLEAGGLSQSQLRGVQRIQAVACGTAYHACLVAKHLIEKLARLPVDVDIASEFRYRNPVLDKNTLMLIISQSGETADTLAVLRQAKQWDIPVLAVTNVVGSSAEREADYAMRTLAGPEIAVASTKAFSGQITASTVLALALAQARDTLETEQMSRFIQGLEALPSQVNQWLLRLAGLEPESALQQAVSYMSRQPDVFYIGRGLDYVLALEGQLKLKEISYLHAEAYPAGELKHGTLALIEEGTPVVALATQQDVHAKTMSNIEELRARGAHITGIGFEDDLELQRQSDVFIDLPRVPSELAPVLAVVPLQLLAYRTALKLGHDVDKPRHLAKSVTVE